MTAETGRGRCEDFVALLEDCLESGLDSAAPPDVQLHLRSCAACSAALEEARLGNRLLAIERAAVPQPGALFMQRVMAAIRRESAEPASLWVPLQSMARRFALSAALALALLTAYVLGPGNPRRILPAPDARVAAVSEIVPDPFQPPVSSDEVLLNIAETSHGK